MTLNRKQATRYNDFTDAFLFVNTKALMVENITLVRVEKRVYMAPELLLHYISEHRCCPPQEFVHATIHGGFLGPDDLEIRWRGEGN